MSSYCFMLFHVVSYCFINLTSTASTGPVSLWPRPLSGRKILLDKPDFEIKNVILTARVPILILDRAKFTYIAQIL